MYVGKVFDDKLKDWGYIRLAEYSESALGIINIPASVFETDSDIRREAKDLLLSKWNTDGDNQNWCLELINLPNDDMVEELHYSLREVESYC